MTDDEFGEAIFYSVGKRFRDKDEDSRIGFEEWNLVDVSSLEKLIKKTLRAGFALAEKEYECHAWFAAEYTDGAEMPPGIIAVELPLGPTEGSGPSWTFSLNDMVERLIEFNREGEDENRPIAEESRAHVTELRDELRTLADMLDAALKGEKYVEK